MKRDPKKILLEETKRWGAADCPFVGARGLSRFGAQKKQL